MKTQNTQSFYSFLSLAALLLIAGCTPKIIVMDRQTILEQEAAGEWPQIENELLQNSSVQGPVPFPKTVVSTQKARLYNVLNGELVRE